MPYRNLWLIDMGDGTWAVCCMACRLALYRGPKHIAAHAFAGHRCEPVPPSAADAGRHDTAHPAPRRRQPDPSRTCGS